MKYLITGGAGFIGSNLAKRILNKRSITRFYSDGTNGAIKSKLSLDHELNYVSVVDNLSTGRIENIKDLFQSIYFKFYCDSVLNEDLMDELIKDCDIVFHLAANVGVERVEKTPFLTLYDDINSTRIILEKAKKYWKKVLYMSSSEVYGFAEPPLYEDFVSIFPQDLRCAYAQVKMLNETLAMTYNKEFGLPIIIIRLFNTTGEGQLSEYGMVLPRFIKNKIQSKVPIIYGDGDQTRCFSHVDDIVDTLWNIVKKEEAYGQIFNLGSTEEISIKELAEKMNHWIYTFEPARQFDVARRKPDISKITKLLGYNPIKINLDEIIKRMFEYEKNC